MLDARISEIFHISRVIANFDPNFVAMATRVGCGRIWLTSINSPTPKTPWSMQESWTYLSHKPSSRAPEAVWQVWRPPYQSKIWYGDAIPIKSKAANLFIICNKSTDKNICFLYVSKRWVLSCDSSRKDSKHSHRARVVYIYGEYTKSI